LCPTQLRAMSRFSVILVVAAWTFAAQAAVTQGHSLKKLRAAEVAAPAAAAPAAAAPAVAAPAVAAAGPAAAAPAAAKAKKKVKKEKKVVAAKTTKKVKKQAKAEDDDEEDEDETAEEKAQDVKEDAEEAGLKKDVTVAKAALHENAEKQKFLKAELSHLQDTKASNMEIEANVKLVSKETESKALAGMMGSMWKEMRQFELPDYAPHAQKEIAALQAKEAGLKANLAKAQAALDAKEKQWADEDKEDEEGDDKEHAGSGDQIKIKSTAFSAKTGLVVAALSYSCTLVL